MSRPSLCRLRRRLVRTVLAFVPLLTAVLCERLVASDPGSAAKAEDVEHAVGRDFRESIEPLLRQHCFDCHGPEMQESSLRLDTLAGPLANRRAAETWENVLDMLKAGKMPPEDAEQLKRADRLRLMDRITGELTRAAENRRLSHGGQTRRLTVNEYNRTMQSLFGVAVNFAATLPPDPISPDGYQNDRGLLTISTLQMEYYLEIARTSVSRYVVFGSSDVQPTRYHIELEELYYTVRDRYETCRRAPEPLGIEAFAARRKKNSLSPAQFTTPLSPIPPGDLPAVEELRPSQPKLHQQFLPIRAFSPVGDLIVRVKAASTPGRNGSLPRMRVACGMAYGDGDGMDAHSLGEADVTASVQEPAVYVFRGRMEDLTKPENPGAVDSVFDMLQLFVSNVSRDERATFALGTGSGLHPETPSTKKSPAKLKQALRERAKIEARINEMADRGVNLLHLDAVEIEIIPGVTSAVARKWSVDMALSAKGRAGQQAAARDFLGRFMRQAYRRPVSAREIGAKLNLFDRFLAAGGSFEESLRETLVSVLVSPHFLFLEAPLPHTPEEAERSADSQPSPHQLASRLSYFLWSSMPDERLMDLADSGDLASPQVYADEAARMLDDSRSRRFVDDFCRQWLRLDRFPLVAVNPEYFPAYDDDFGETTVQETIAYFAEVFFSDSSAIELIDSDYAMLNDRLARHYHLPPIAGGELRKVALPTDSVRGGLLTQAAILTMNSDGVDSHPIRRGVWILDRLLNDPPPPPPPNVPDIDEEAPDFRGLSLQQRIALHREPSACKTCHQKIDPWGIVLENFDAVGRWREKVRVRKEGQDSLINVDAAAKLPDGTALRGARELQRHLLGQHQEHFTRSIVHHMLTYALGRGLDFADREEVERIHRQFAASGYRLRNLALAIASSATFRQ